MAKNVIADGNSVIDNACQQYGFCPGREGVVRTFYEYVDNVAQESDDPGAFQVSITNEKSEQLICFEFPAKGEGDDD